MAENEAAKVEPLCTKCGLPNSELDVDALTVAAEIADETFRPTLAKRLRAMMTLAVPTMDVRARIAELEKMNWSLRVENQEMSAVIEEARKDDHYDAWVQERLANLNLGLALREAQGQSPPLDAQALAEAVDEIVDMLPLSRRNALWADRIRATIERAAGRRG